MPTHSVYVSRDDRVPDRDYEMGLEPLLKRSEIEVSFIPERDSHELMPDDVRGADALITIEDILSEETLDSVDPFNIVAAFGAGIDHLDIDACTQRGIPVVNSPQGPRDAVAQTTLGMLISCASSSIRYNNLIRTQGFEGRFENMGVAIYGKRLGLIGFGQIASRVVELIEPFGMDIVTYDPYVSEAKLGDYGVERVDFPKLLRTSDFVSLHCPLTDETRNLLGTEEFETMQSTAYLVNTTRGGIYPDEELAAAIEAGEIAGAAIDVFEDEPDVSANPLLTLDDCLITPHVAGVLRDTMIRQGNMVSEAILSVFDGQVPHNLLNPEVYDHQVDESLLSPSHRGETVKNHYRS